MLSPQLFKSQMLFVTLALSIALTLTSSEAKIYLWLYDNSTHLNRLSASINSLELTGVGSPLPEGGIRGTMYQPNPRGSCSRVAEPDNITGLKKIAIIDTIECDIVSHVYKLELAGYSAVIIPQEYYSPTLARKSGAASKLTVSVVQTNYAAIENLMNYAYENENKTYAWDPRLSEVVILPTDFNWQALLLSFGIVLAVSLFTIACFSILKLIFNIIKRFRSYFQSPRVRRIPTRRYGTESELYDKCPICLDDFCPGVVVRQLPCSHIYHVKCIDQWLSLDHQKCPLCKRDIFLVTQAGVERGLYERTPLLPPTEQVQTPTQPENATQNTQSTMDLTIERERTYMEISIAQPEVRAVRNEISITRPQEEIRNYQSVP